MGFNYKVSKKTKCLSLLQLVFTHGVKSPIVKAKNETEDNMQTAILRDDQHLCIFEMKRVDALFVKTTFMDHNVEIVFTYLNEAPSETDVT